MLGTLLKWAFLLASGALLVLALTPAMQRWLNQNGFIPDPNLYGDLYNIANLAIFKDDNFGSNDTLSAGDKPVKHYTDVHLYTLGDSFSDIDTSYYAGGRNVHVWVGIKAKIEPHLVDKTKKNILIIESIERFLQVRLFYPTYESIYLKEGIVEPEQYKLIASQTAKENKTMPWLFTRFEGDINQRLELLLFNRWPFNRLKETKAKLMLNGFGRVQHGAYVSPDKKNVFYQDEVDTISKISAFRYLSDQKIDTLVTNVNKIRQHYLAMGFNEVYICLVPNKVTVWAPTLGVYNHQIERFEANPRLQAPLISLIDSMRQHPTWYHLGDGHWTKDGKRLWLRQVNKIVANWSDQR